MSDEERPGGYVQFVYADVDANEFVNLGGAGWDTAQEARRHFEALPEADGEVYIMADLLDEEMSIIDDRRVSVETVESRLGEPLAALIARGREENRRREAQFRELRRASKENVRRVTHEVLARARAVRWSSGWSRRIEGGPKRRFWTVRGRHCPVIIEHAPSGKYEIRVPCGPAQWRLFDVRDTFRRARNAAEAWITIAWACNGFDSSPWSVPSRRERRR